MKSSPKGKGGARVGGKVLPPSAPPIGRYRVALTRTDKTALLRTLSSIARKARRPGALDGQLVLARVLAARDSLKKARPPAAALPTVELPDQEALHGLQLGMEVLRLGTSDPARTLRLVRLCDSIIGELARSAPDQLADLANSAPRDLTPPDLDPVASNSPASARKSRTARQATARKQLRSLARPGKGLDLVARVNAQLLALGLSPDAKDRPL